MTTPLEKELHTDAVEGGTIGGAEWLDVVNVVAKAPSDVPAMRS